MSDLNTYKRLVQERLEKLRTIFSKASVGDFSENVPLYEEDDEFTEFYVGIQVMIDVIRSQLSELKELNAALETTVADLRHEIDLRAKLEKRKDEFIAVLGHELRNPLAPILYSTEIIKHSLLNADVEMPEALKQVGVIERQGAHMTRLIHDMLDVSRILYGKLELKRAPLDLREIARRAVETVTPFMREKRHLLNLNLGEEALIVYGDPLRLEQIIVNLLNNAARYTPNEGTITLSLARQANEAQLSIQDTGIGISPDFIDKIFDIFVQTKDLEAHEGGLGMGLMIARSLARLHGGDVTAMSNGLNRGSTFRLTLPLLSKPNEAIILNDQLPENELSAPSSRRILVVDDNTDLANSVAEVLRKFGHNVAVAYSGERALEVAQTFKPETVFLDLAMPDMDGFAVLEMMKRDSLYSAARIVALTGFGQPSDFEKTKAAGFHAHLVKPPKLAELLGAIG